MATPNSSLVRPPQVCTVPFLKQLLSISTLPLELDINQLAGGCSEVSNICLAICEKYLQ